MNNSQDLPPLCSYCNSYRSSSPVDMSRHQLKRNGCIQAYMRAQLDTSHLSSSRSQSPNTEEDQASDMSISVGGVESPISDMSISLADGVSPYGTESVISDASNEESKYNDYHKSISSLSFEIDQPFVYDYVGSNLQLSFSDQISIKLNNLNAEHNATRQHKRELVKFLNEILIGPLIGNNQLGIVPSVFFFI